MTARIKIVDAVMDFLERRSEIVSFFFSHFKLLRQIAETLPIKRG